MTLPGWGRKVLLLAIIPVPHVVIKGLMIWGSKCHQNNSPVVCDGYVKYEEAQIDRYH